MRTAIRLQRQGTCRRRVAKATGKMPVDELDERACVLALMASVVDNDDDVQQLVGGGSGRKTWRRAIKLMSDISEMSTQNILHSTQAGASRRGVLSEHIMRITDNSTAFTVGLSLIHCSWPQPEYHGCLLSRTE